MALTAAQIAALQAEADAKRAEADAAVAMAFAAYSADHHALCATVNDEEVTIPVSTVSAGLLYLDSLDDWKAALGIAVGSEPFVPSAAMTAMNELSPVENSIPLFASDDSVSMLGVSPLAETLLAATTQSEFRGLIGVPEGTGMGNVQEVTGSVTDGALVLFDGTDGQTIKEGPALSADVLEFLAQANYADMKLKLNISEAAIGDLTEGNSLKALISDEEGNVVASAVTSTELSKLSGIGATTIAAQLALKKDTAKLACGFATCAKSNVDKVIAFGKTFASPPVVVTTSVNAWIHCRVKSVTTTGFTVNANGIDYATFNWIAMLA